ASLGGSQVGHLGDVGAGHEGLGAGSGEHHHAHRRIVGRGVGGGVKGVQGGRVERVQPLGTVHRDDPDGVMVGNAQAGVVHAESAAGGVDEPAAGTCRARPGHREASVAVKPPGRYPSASCRGRLDRPVSCLGRSSGRSNPPLESDRMKVRLLAASLAALILVSATASAQDTSSERGKLSYAIGFNTGVELAELAARGEAVDVNTVIKAIQDAYAKKQPAVPVEELKTAVENMQKRQQAKMEAEFNQLASQNKAQSDAFLAQNRAKQGVQTLPGSTVQYRVIENGSGAKPTQNSDVQLNYRGTLPDGT